MEHRIVSPLLSRLLGLGAEMPDTVEIGLAVVTYLAYLQSQYDTFCLDFLLENPALAM